MVRRPVRVELGATPSPTPVFLPFVAGVATVFLTQVAVAVIAGLIVRAVAGRFMR